MRYTSTRGGVHGISFVDAVLMGLASDGGLLVPEETPDVRGQLNQWRGLSFVELAQQVIPLFVDDIERETLDRLIVEAYATFDHPDVVAWHALGDVSVLELFHGPTLAFKDVALQLLGRLFEYILGIQHQHLNILGATSGDTGSAAIAGVRGQRNVDILILYPDNKVSRLQELQMTTVPDANVHCIAVDGSFDDCQSLMKQTFSDLAFKEEFNLGAINSVNWARVLAQIVYYGYASLKFDEAPAFCVPTGNFGNVFAAYMARQMGFPVDSLLVATNENDILARFFATGEYSRGEVHFTLSPAMDIQVASNFERFLYYYFEKDSERLTAFMTEFARTGHASIGGPPTDGLFTAVAIDTAATLGAIKSVYDEYGYMLDPHTAVAYAASEQFKDQLAEPRVCIATAHPAKFPEAVRDATKEAVAIHPSLEALVDLPERKTKISADIESVKDSIRRVAGRKTDTSA
jgi:threonine synthase